MATPPPRPRLDRGGQPPEAHRGHHTRRGRPPPPGYARSSAPERGWQLPFDASRLPGVLRRPLPSHNPGVNDVDREHHHGDTDEVGGDADKVIDALERRSVRGHPPRLAKKASGEQREEREVERDEEEPEVDL